MKTHYLRQIGTLTGLLLLIIVFWILSPYFFTLSNLLNIAQQTVINAIISVGMTVVIITAGIDLSVGSILAFSGVILGNLLHSNVPLFFSLIIGITIGVIIGVINGAFIAYGRIPPFIATLGMMSIARGAALLFTGGKPVSNFSSDFRFIANGTICKIPFPILLMIFIYIMTHIVLTRTRFGRYVYSIGGNEEASVLSGINVKKIKIYVYGISGMMCGISAIILTSRLNSAQPIAGIMYELDAIAATVIGGTSLMGGEGTIIGTFIGAFLMGVLRNGLNILDISAFIQQIIIGSVIIGAVFIDMMLKKNKK